MERVRVRRHVLALLLCDEMLFSGLPIFGTLALRSTYEIRLMYDPRTEQHLNDVYTQHNM